MEEKGKLFTFVPKERNCKHIGSVVLDEQTRTVECELCKKTIDPFDFMYLCAIEERSVLYELGELRRQRNKLKREVEKIKSERRLLGNSLIPK